MLTNDIASASDADTYIVTIVQKPIFFMFVYLYKIPASRFVCLIYCYGPPASLVMTLTRNTWSFAIDTRFELNGENIVSCELAGMKIIVT